MKRFKYVMTDREGGKFLASQEVTFKDFPEDWKDNGMAQRALFEQREEFINKMIEVKVTEI